jgi:ribosomal protein S20
MMPRARLTIALASVVLVAVALTGCSSTPPDLQQSTATQLQAGVQNVTAAAAAGDFEAAQASLEAVQSDLLTAAAADGVSAARAADIQAALNLVSADLLAAIEASKPEPTLAPAPVPSPTQTSVDKGNDKDNGKCKKNDDCDDD